MARILVVDSDQAQADRARFVLESFGFPTHTVDDLGAASEYLSEHRVAVVVLAAPDQLAVARTWWPPAGTSLVVAVGDATAEPTGEVTINRPYRQDELIGAVSGVLRRPPAVSARRVTA